MIRTNNPANIMSNFWEVIPSRLIFFVSQTLTQISLSPMYLTIFLVLFSSTLTINKEGADHDTGKGISL